MVRPSAIGNGRALSDAESVDGVDVGDDGVDFDTGGTDPGSGTVAPPAAESLQVVSASGSAVELDFSIANWWDITLTADCTFTIVNPPASGSVGLLHVILRQGGSGSYTVTWPAEVEWPAADATTGGPAPTLHTVVGARDEVELITEDGGTSYGGTFGLGSSGGSTPFDHGSMGSTETIDLDDGDWHRGTLNAACAITVTGFAVDVGVVAVCEFTQDGTGGRGITWDADVDFGGADDQPDLTANVTTVFILTSSEGDTHIFGAKFGGAASTTSTGDHFIAIASSHSTPLVFGDLVQTSAGDDLVYTS